jgi:hypothetical protein
MHKERVGEIHRKRVFEAAELKTTPQKRDCADSKRNAIAIAVFIPSFSDVP